VIKEKILANSAPEILNVVKIIFWS